MHERLFLRLDGDPLHAPGTTVPAGTMRELRLPAALRERVAHVIAYDEHLPAGATVRERVLPDGAVRVIVDFGSGAARVVGPSTRPVVLSMQGHLSGLSITLRPGACLALFRVPAHELAEQVVDWDALAAAGHRDLPALLGGAVRDTGRARLLCEAFQAMTRCVDGEERRKAERAADLLRAGGDALSVAAVAAAVGVGERRLQQIFRSQLGLSPLAWRRLCRVQRCLQLLRLPTGMPWPELAVAAGFYDQSHLVNDFRSLCGLAPGQFLQRFGSGFSRTA